MSATSSDEAGGGASTKEQQQHGKGMPSSLVPLFVQLHLPSPVAETRDPMEVSPGTSVPQTPKSDDSRLEMEGTGVSSGVLDEFTHLTVLTVHGGPEGEARPKSRWEDGTDGELAGQASLS